MKTEKELEEAIAGISVQMKGPLSSHTERMMLHGDRQDLKKQLAELRQSKGLDNGFNS